MPNTALAQYSWAEAAIKKIVKQLERNGLKAAPLDVPSPSRARCQGAGGMKNLRSQTNCPYFLPK
jgi:hypothetical protein